MPDEKVTINISEEQIKKPAKESKKDVDTSKKWLTVSIFGAVAALAGVACLVASFLIPKEALPDLTFPKIPSSETTGEKVYSNLTGLELANADQKTAPAYCIQTPNGTDGARPQSGLTDAGVVFEAIAEAGITRFAAIYQNPSQAVIGPIRSLRMYFLDWDVPFDCIIINAGGSADAIDSLRAGGYKNLQENYAYMYRGTYGGRLWNNLFTTSAYLQQFANDAGFTKSEIKGFARMTPDEAKRKFVDSTVSEKINITKATEKDTSARAAEVARTVFNFGGWDIFNVVYDYDISSNTYKRTYADGEPHNVYNCPADNLGERNPEDVCSLVQLSPSVVIAMVVEERRAADNYHENITTAGSGKAYVFQNGTVTVGTWKKDNRESQIQFLDENGAEIKLIPGQTFISAVPNYGSVAY